MALKRPTISSCIDDKGHTWLIVSEEKDQNGQQWEHRWCQKCGALTQVVYNDQGEAIAVNNPNNTPFLLIPKVLLSVTK